MYDEEKKKNEHKTRRIRILEKIIRDMGGVIPKDTFGAGQGDTEEKVEIPEVVEDAKSDDEDLLDKEEVK